MIKNSKKINGSITILFSDDGLSIDLIDNDSLICFAKIFLTHKQMTKAFSRLAYTPCQKVEVIGLDKVGKIHQHKKFSFTIPKSTSLSDIKEVAKKTVISKCPEGWEPDLYFDSQNSFEYNKKNSIKVNTIIRRWVDKSHSPKRKIKRRNK